MCICILVLRGDFPAVPDEYWLSDSMSQPQELWQDPQGEWYYPKHLPQLPVGLLLPLFLL